MLYVALQWLKIHVPYFNTLYNNSLLLTQFSKQEAKNNFPTNLDSFSSKLAPGWWYRASSTMAEQWGPNCEQGIDEKMSDEGEQVK